MSVKDKETREYIKARRERIRIKHAEKRKEMARMVYRLSNDDGKKDVKSKACSCIRSIICHRLKFGNGESETLERLAGYTVRELRAHIESQFQEGMSWGNYGYDGWTLDHIIPVSVFNFSTTDDEDFKRCWALDNLQPMWGADNIRKSNKLEAPHQPTLQLIM